MKEETIITKLNEQKEQEKEIRHQAKKCLNEKIKLPDPKENLSNQLFENGTSLYLNPTEKILISNLVSPKEAFATVLGSGDFAIDASFHGAGEILTFDINKNQFYPASLKLKGLQNMNYKEYWDFFSNTESADYLSPKKYKELKEISKEDLKLYAFFDEIMVQREKEQINISKALKSLGLDVDLLKQICLSNNIDTGVVNDITLDKLFSIIDPKYNSASTLKIITGMDGVRTKNSYLENEISYQKAKDTIKNTNLSFLRTDLAKLKLSLEKTGYMSKPEYNKFKSIYLSNIPEYINGSSFFHIVEEQLMPLLQEDGVIAYCCQSTNAKTLNMSETKLNELKNNARILLGTDINEFSIYQIINSVEGLKKIRNNFNVDFYETETLAQVNGLEEKDTYVYIRKK